MGKGYLKSLDGLRVIALLGVFFYHLVKGYCPTGYLGVVIFFVFAGFLSMLSIVDRKDEAKFGEAKDKIIGKIEKLYPSLLIVILVTSIIMIAKYQNFLNSYPKEVIGSVLSVNNFVQIASNESYFDAMNSLKPFTHVWALSLEFQFYVLFYLTVFLFYRADKKNTYINVGIAIIIISLLRSASLIYSGASLTRVYYGLDSRISCFMIGVVACIMASKSNGKAVSNKGLIRVVELILIVLSVASMFVPIENNTLVVVALNVYAIIFTALVYIIYLDCKHNDVEKSILHKVLSCGFFHEIVKRSYVIYLVHYPFIIFANRMLAGVMINPYIFLLGSIVAIVIISEIIYRIVSLLFAKNKKVSTILIVLLTIACLGCGFYSMQFKNTENDEGNAYDKDTLLEEQQYAEALKAQGIDIEETESAVEETTVPEVQETMSPTGAFDLENYERQMPEHAEAHFIYMQGKIQAVNDKIGAIAYLDFEDYKKYCGIPITLIGDSVSECAKGALGKYFYNSYLNPAANRELDKLVREFNAMKEKGQIGAVVVVALGTNSTHDIDVEALETVYDELEGRPMIIQTLAIPDVMNETKRNKALTDFAKSHDNCYIADWHAAMKSHCNDPEFFLSDNTHPTKVGNDCFAQLIFKTMIQALNGDNLTKSAEKKQVANASVGDTVNFGHYFINDKTLAEEIEWIILEKDETNNTVTLLSKYGLDAKQYQSMQNMTTWGTSKLRKWLNEDFYKTAFTDLEKEIVLKTTVKNVSNADYKGKDESDTYDSVFLLSLDEARTLVKPEDLKCKGTKYFADNGGYVSDEPGFEGNCDWWLRTSGDFTTHEAYVDSEGNIDSRGDYLINEDFAVRPCITISIE